MTPKQFDLILRVFCRRRPFRAFLIEFASGNQMEIRHPEAIGPRVGLYFLRVPDGGYNVFAAESVTRLLDLPNPTTS